MTAGIVRRLVALVALVVGFAAYAGTAAAHAVVVGIDPADGAVVDEGPQVVTVRFSETVSVAPGGNAVFDATASDLALEVAAVGAELRYTLPADLAEGTYVVSWHVISADSHPVAGSSIFHVGAPSATAAVVPTVGGAPRGHAPAQAVVTAAVWGAALVAVGAGWFARRWSPPVSVAVERLVVASAVVGVVALVGVAALRVVHLGGRWDAVGDPSVVSGALDGPVGWSLVLLAGGLAAQVVAVRARGARFGVWVVGAALVVGGAVVEGHTRTATPAWLVVLGDVAHVSAAAVWLGGVAALAFAWSHATAGRRPALVADVSLHAVVAVAVVAVGGMAMAVAIAPDFGALIDSRWGRAVLVKVALTAVLVAIGWHHRYRLLPRLSGSGGDAAPVATATRTSVRRELGVFAAVLVATGVVVANSPDGGGRSVGTDPAETSTSYTDTVLLSTGVGSVTFVLTPLAVGANDVFVQLEDTDGRPLETLFTPTLRLAEETQGVAPVQLVLDELGEGAHHVSVYVPFPGDWTVTVLARTSTFEVGEAAITLPIGR